jgi:kinesin family protein 5
MSEFDVVKGALLRDLENRCQKVIELEILLDEAREQYQLLLTQVKNSNSKALQQKCNFLQRNLEQLTTVQQQVGINKLLSTRFVCVFTLPPLLVI